MGYRVWFTFRNGLGEDVRDYLDNNGEGFTPDDALNCAREMGFRGHKDINITRLGTVADEYERMHYGN